MSAGNVKRDKLKLVNQQRESGDVPEEINEQEVSKVCEGMSVSSEDPTKLGHLETRQL